MNGMNVTREILALLYEVDMTGVTAHEASERLECKYNSAGIALARLYGEGWATRSPEPSTTTGRKRMRYYVVKEGP